MFVRMNPFTGDMDIVKIGRLEEGPEPEFQNNLVATVLEAMDLT